MSVIAILGVADEIEHLRGRLDGLVTETTPAGTFWRGRWGQPCGIHIQQEQSRAKHIPQGQHEVILARCAIGKVNATMALQWLIDRHAPDVLLNFGSSGAIAPQLRVGDVVIADRVVPYDVGVFLERGFVTTGNELPNLGHAHWRVFPADPRLVHLAQKATERAKLVSSDGNRPGRAWVGTIASGDQVVFADEKKRWLHETFGALAVENEGAAVAQVAAAHGLPWLVLRGISDTADAHAAFDYTPLLRYADEGTGWLAWLRYQARRVIHLLRHPETRTNWHRFNAGVRLVNTNVAALLEHMLPLL